MTQSPDNLLPVGAILSSSHWPDCVRVVRVEPRGTSGVPVEAITLDERSRPLSRLAHSHDPLFAARAAGMDPLPHQPEGAYYVQRQPRLRFLPADEPGAGKAVLAGLWLKQLKPGGAGRAAGGGKAGTAILAHQGGRGILKRRCISLVR